MACEITCPLEIQTPKIHGQGKEIIRLIFVTTATTCGGIVFQAEFKHFCVLLQG